MDCQIFPMAYMALDISHTYCLPWSSSQWKYGCNRNMWNSKKYAGVIWVITFEFFWWKIILSPAWKEPIKYTYTYSQVEIDSCYYRDWEAPWSDTVNWEPRKISGIIQSEFEGLGTRGANGLSRSPSPKASQPGALMSQDRSWMSQLREKENSPFFLVLVLFWPSLIGWCTHLGEGNLLYSVYQFKC